MVKLNLFSYLTSPNHHEIPAASSVKDTLLAREASSAIARKAGVVLGPDVSMVTGVAQ